MPAPLSIPPQLTNGPFTPEEARTCRISEKVLRSKRFRRVFPGVWVLASYAMNDLDWIRAAELALPDDARASHLTRLRKLGLEDGSLHPMHFTIDGELHLQIPGIVLHRTKVMLPTDSGGFTPTAAFIGYAAGARIIDLIKVGDWLLRHEHMTIGGLIETARHQRWRPGAKAAIWVSRFLNGRSRSLKESETRALLVFAGLPAPELNIDIDAEGQIIACVDMLYRRWLLVLEYEGRQHAEDPYQFNKDITRYAGLRGGQIEYVQITQERLMRPRSLVTEVHTKLVERGYDGPAPEFGALWRCLFERHRASIPVAGGIASTLFGEVDAEPPPLVVGGR